MSVIDPVIFFLLSTNQRRVTLNKLVEEVQCHRKGVLRAMDKLTAEGYLEEIEDNPQLKGYKDFGPQKQNPTWKVVGDLSSRPTRQPKRDTDRDKIWRAIRNMVQGFTRTDLMRLSGASHAAVEDYTKLLERDGHIKTMGRNGRQKKYRLVSEELKRPKISEKPKEKVVAAVAANSDWLVLLQQRIDDVGGAEVARELGIAPGSVSLLKNNKYPASTAKMEEKILKMYSQGGVIECPVRGEMTPAECVETYNKAVQLGGLGGNPQQTKLYKTCLKCDFRKRG